MPGKKIPDLPEKELEARFARMRPVMRVVETKQGFVSSEKEDDLRFIRVESPYETFTVNPRVGNPVTVNPSVDKPPVVIRKLKKIITYHYLGFIPELKPTCEEVMSQIPSDCLNRVCAFEVEMTVRQKQTDSNYICTTTVLYEHVRVKK